MFEHLRRTAAASRIADELLHEQVVLELARGERRLGLWAKALSDSLGDEQKAKAFYIRYRVRSMRDELEIERTASSQSSPERTATAHRPPDQDRQHSHELPQLPTDPCTLVDMLAKALGDQNHQQVSVLIDRLRLDGFDNDSIELLVEDRLGANGVRLLWRQSSFANNS